MKTVGSWLYRQVAIGLVLLVTAQFGLSAAAQEVPSTQQQPAPVPIQSAASASPSSDAEIASLPNSPAPIAPQTAPASQPQNRPQTTPQQQNTPAQPLGTAAAPSEPASGVAASRPAGAAIAPAKQKRSRTFAIRIALLVGAAVAVGTVVALSSASPSRRGASRPLDVALVTPPPTATGALPVWSEVVDTVVPLT